MKRPVSTTRRPAGRLSVGRALRRRPLPDPMALARSRVRRPSSHRAATGVVNYGLMIYLSKPNGEVFARDGVSIQVLGHESDDE